MEKFAVFILSNGRPNSQITLEVLLKNGYTGKWFIVVDDLDETINEYIENYGKNRIIIFDKLKEYKITDTMSIGNNPNILKSVLYARNFVQRYAQQNGYKFYFMSDDDMTEVRYRYKDGKALRGKSVTNFDGVIKHYIDFLKSSEHIYSLGFARGSAFIGGLSGWKDKKFSYGVYANAFMKAKNNTKFYGIITEDLNASVTDIKVGKLHLSPVIMHLLTREKSKFEGGMTPIYEEGLYQTMFYGVMANPDVCSINLNKNNKLILRTNWRNVVPKVLSENIKKVAK